MNLAVSPVKLSIFALRISEVLLLVTFGFRTVIYFWKIGPFIVYYVTTFMFSNTFYLKVYLA